MADPATYALIAAGATIASTVVSAGASIYEGHVAKESAYAAAQQEEAKGDAEFANMQRQAEERKFEAALILSKQQAAAAASGGGAGADAPTIVKIMEKTAQRAEYGRASVIYAGGEAKKSYYASAAARRKSGDNSFLGGILSGGGQVLGGIGSFAEMKS